MIRRSAKGTAAGARVAAVFVVACAAASVACAQPARAESASSWWRFLVPGDADALALGGRPLARAGDETFPTGIPPAGSRLLGARDVIARSRGAGDAWFDLSHDVNRVEGFLPLAGSENALRVAATRTQLHAGGWNDRRQGAELSGDTQVGRVGLHRRSVLGGGSANAAFGAELVGARAETRESWGWTLEGGVELARRGTFRVTAWREPHPSRLIARAGEERYLLPLDLETRAVEPALRAELPWGLAAEGRMAWGSARSASDAGEDEYRLAPELDWKRASWTLSLTGGVYEAGVHGEHARLDGNGEARRHDLRFGRIFAAGGRYDRWSVAMERRLRDRGLLLLDAERLDARIEARGDVQSWPFSETVVDLLGVRLFYRGEARVRVDKIHAGLAFGPGRAGLSWFDAAIDGTATTWNPQYLVFGRQNVQEYAFPLSRARGFLLSGGLEHDLGPVSIHYTFLQLVPTSTRKREDRGTPGGEEGSPPGGSDASAAASALQLDGGRLHALQVGWRWGSAPLDRARR